MTTLEKYENKLEALEQLYKATKDRMITKYMNGDTYEGDLLNENCEQLIERMTLVSLVIDNLRENK